MMPEGAERTRKMARINMAERFEREFKALARVAVKSLPVVGGYVVVAEDAPEFVWDMVESLREGLAFPCQQVLRAG